MGKELFVMTRKIQRKMLLSSLVLSVSLVSALAMHKEQEDGEHNVPPPKPVASAAGAVASGAAASSQKHTNSQFRPSAEGDDWESFYNGSGSQTSGSQAAGKQACTANAAVANGDAGAAGSAAGSGRKSPRMRFVPSTDPDYEGGWDINYSQSSSQGEANEAQAAPQQASSTPQVVAAAEADSK